MMKDRIRHQRLKELMAFHLLEKLDWKIRKRLEKHIPSLDRIF